MHATVFLSDSQSTEVSGMAVLYGSDRYLKSEALNAITQIYLGEERDSSLTKFQGKEIELRTVIDELRTVSMWGDRRLVVVEDADDFVSTYRKELEKYINSPAKKSLLVLWVKSWPKNTRLAKAISKMGVAIECQQLKGQAQIRWVIDIAASAHQKKLSTEAAALLVHLIGGDFGMLKQELEKLASYVGEKKIVSPEDIRKMVGGWRTETTWTMLQGVRDGNSNLSLKCLVQLLHSGEAPQKLMGGIAFVFRKVAQAVETTREGLPLSQALQAAGVFPREISLWSNYLRRVGRPEAEKISQRLHLADSALKGQSRINPQFLLEKLLVELAG